MAPDLEIRMLIGEVSVGVVLAIVGVGLFLKRRHLFPINSRHIPLVVGKLFGLLVGTYIVQVFSFLNFYCSWMRVTANVFYVHVFNCLLLRVFRLWFTFESSLEKFRAQKDGSSRSLNSKRHSRRDYGHLFFTYNRRFNSNSFLGKALVVMDAVVIVVFVAMFMLLSTELDVEDENCRASVTMFSVVMGFAGFTALVTTAFLFKMRQLKDVLGIKREIHFEYLVAAVYMALVLGFEGTEQALYQWFPDQLYLLVSIYYPVWLSYRTTERNSSAQPSVDEATLQEVLSEERYKEARESFEDYLLHDFSVENILFYKASLTFEAEVDDLTDDEAAVAALGLYVEFLADDAPYQINVHHKIFKSTRDELSGCFRDLDVAQKILERSERRLSLASEWSEPSVAYPTPASEEIELSSLPPTTSPLGSTSKPSQLESASISLGLPAKRPSAARPEQVDKLIREVTGRPRHTIFHEARESVVKLLQGDTFLRWRRAERRKVRRQNWLMSNCRCV